MLVVTTNDIPGWEIQRVCGEVFGLTVRSRNAFAQMGAGFKSMFGGENGSTGLDDSYAAKAFEIDVVIAVVERFAVRSDVQVIGVPLTVITGDFSGVPVKRVSMPVSIGPGPTAFTRMPN